MTRKNEPQRFAFCDKVWWSSQSGGFRSTKRGRVIWILAPGEMPYGLDFVAYWRGRKRLGNGDLPRNHESYLVVVGKTETSSGTLYWPRVNALKRVEE